MVVLSKKLGLIAGDGKLQVILARSAANSGFKIVAISLSPDNRALLSNHCEKVYSFGPGELQKIADTLHLEEITQLSFVGKVHKGLLFKNPRLDMRALKLLKQKKKLNDDAVMQAVIDELEKEQIIVLDQTIFLKELLAVKGVIGKFEPTKEQMLDIEYGFHIAKEIGKLDLGQTVVVKNKMILAVETIEGTDKAIERGCKLAKSGAVIVKVSKPKQDKRFDIPTVGLKTLKAMAKYKAKILAIESGETFIAQKDKMIEFANKNKMVIISV